MRDRLLTYDCIERQWLARHPRKLWQDGLLMPNSNVRHALPRQLSKLRQDRPQTHKDMPPQGLTRMPKLDVVV